MSAQPSLLQKKMQRQRVIRHGLCCHTIVSGYLQALPPNCLQAVLAKNETTLWSYIRLVEFLPEKAFNNASAQAMDEMGEMAPDVRAIDKVSLPCPLEAIDGASIGSPLPLSQDGYDMVKQMLQTWFVKKCFWFLMKQHAEAHGDRRVLVRLAASSLRHLDSYFQRCKLELLLLESCVRKHGQPATNKGKSIWCGESFWILDFASEFFAGKYVGIIAPPQVKDEPAHAGPSGAAAHAGPKDALVATPLGRVSFIAADESGSLKRKGDQSPEWRMKLPKRNRGTPFLRRTGEPENQVTDVFRMTDMAS